MINLIKAELFKLKEIIHFEFDWSSSFRLCIG